MASRKTSRSVGLRKDERLATSYHAAAAMASARSPVNVGSGKVSKLVVGELKLGLKEQNMRFEMLQENDWQEMLPKSVKG